MLLFALPLQVCQKKSVLSEQWKHSARLALQTKPRNAPTNFLADKHNVSQSPAPLSTILTSSLQTSPPAHLTPKAVFKLWSFWRKLPATALWLWSHTTLNLPRNTAHASCTWRTAKSSATQCLMMAQLKRQKRLQLLKQLKKHKQKPLHLKRQPSRTRWRNCPKRLKNSKSTTKHQWSCPQQYLCLGTTSSARRAGPSSPQLLAQSASSA